MESNHTEVLERLHRLELLTENFSPRDAGLSEEEKAEVEDRIRRLEKQLGIRGDS